MNSMLKVALILIIDVIVELFVEFMLKKDSSFFYLS